MTISKETLKLIRASLDKALETVAKEHNLRQLRSGNCTFDHEGSFTFKVEGIAANGASKEEQLYDMLHIASDVWPERRTDAARFMYGGKLIELCGANSTLSKVIYVDVASGKKYLTAKPAMQSFLEQRAKAAGKQPDNSRFANALVAPPTGRAS